MENQVTVADSNNYLEGEFTEIIMSRPGYVNNPQNNTDIQNNIVSIYGFKLGFEVGENEYVRLLNELTRLLIDSGINKTPDQISVAINRSKQELIEQYISDINILLQGGRIPLRQQPTRGRGLYGELLDKAFNILTGPVGGKLRKTSKKRPTRRGRSSKARKARRSSKVSKPRTTRRR